MILTIEKFEHRVRFLRVGEIVSSKILQKIYIGNDVVMQTSNINTKMVKHTKKSYLNTKENHNR